MVVADDDCLLPLLLMTVVRVKRCGGYCGGWLDCSCLTMMMTMMVMVFSLSAHGIPSLLIDDGDDDGSGWKVVDCLLEYLSPLQWHWILLRVVPVRGNVSVSVSE